jgi:hypothetical protein
MKAAVKSLAEELSRLTHLQQPTAENEDRQRYVENMGLAYLFRLIPDLCAHHIEGLAELVFTLSELQDHEPEEVTRQYQ